MSIDISLHGEPIELEKEVEAPLTKTVDPSRNEIIGLLINILTSEESVDELKTSIKISDKSIEFIRLMVNNSPEIFKIIEKDINAIITDGILDTEDLPLVVLLVKDVLNLNLSSINSSIKGLTVQDSIQFIKDLLIILIKEDYIIVRDEKKVKKLIDNCIDLLSSTINVKTTLFSLASSALSLSCCKK